MELDSLIDSQFHSLPSPQLSFDDVSNLLDNTDFDDELDATNIVNSISPVDTTDDTGDTQQVDAADAQRNAQCEMHYNTLMCDHDECRQAATLEMALGFSDMPYAKRMAFIEAMLYSLSCPPSHENNLMRDVTILSRKKKRRIDDEENSTFYARTAYALRGQPVCVKAFAAVVGLCPATVRRHALNVSQSTRPLEYTNLSGDRRRGKWGFQRIVVSAFLRHLASDYGMECPRGRGSTDETPLRLLPSHFTKRKTFQNYEKEWKSLADGLSSVLMSGTKPTKPVSYSLFVRYWFQDMKYLRIASTGSDFCDTCISLRDTISSLGIDNPVADAASLALSKHLNEARGEFQCYKALFSSARDGRKSPFMHFVFDYAEKVLLPRLQKQPGQLHFVTGLKFDINGVACSNSNSVDIFGLVEGHWPQEKTANTVLSMLHHSVEAYKACENSENQQRRLVLHADNCSGQNKNRFVLFYVLWRVLLGIEDEVVLYFLMAGHTKNVCDGAFGHVKRCLRKSDAIVPSDMMDIIENSSSTNNCVPGHKVQWYDWKTILTQYFTMPSSCKISQYHVFTARSASPGSLYVKALSTDGGELAFNLLKSEPSQPTLADLRKKEFMLRAKSLKEVPSKHLSTRHNYLKVNVLDRYYRNNEEVQHQFFENGTSE